MQADRKHKRRTETQTLHWTLSFAQGYLELGMFSAAERELSKLSLKQRCLADALELRVRVMLHQGRYKRAAALSSSAAKMYPGVAEFYSYAATAYEQLDQPENAKNIWISAPSLFHVSGIFHFALARFEAQLGNEIEARQHIALAIELDPTIQSRAARDPGLSGFLVDFAQPSAPEPATGLAETW